MVGIISFINHIWSSVINAVSKRSSAKTWTYTVYSEDTNRIDEVGGPYTVRIPRDSDHT